ncbi:hypothetical protein ILP97_43015 [Amycolatopsis sp. H6(2020)]|nr:hypothetical protein [Amycolatopsis sp. H6(2020)]
MAPDGAGYHSLGEFVDDTKLLKPGDRVSGPSGLPDAPDDARTEELTKSDPTAAPWIVVGFAVVGVPVLAVLIFTALGLVRRARARRDADRLLGDWDLPSED